jgi:hypothetical protein
VTVVAVVLVLAIRAALPAIVRSVLEDQGTALLQGRLAVGDVDLSLLRGLVTLEDVALRPDDAPPDATPLVACKKLWVNLGWLALASKTIEVQDVGVQGLAVRVDRLSDGALVLPSVRAAGAAAPPAPEAQGEAAIPEARGEAPAPWGVVIDQLALEDASVQLDDHVSDPTERRQVSLPSVRLTNFRLEPDPEAEAGRARVRLELNDGWAELRARVRAVEGGFDIAAALEVADLPLDRVHVHLPQLGWSGSTGRLDALVTARVSPSSPLVARGDVELNDVAVEVPGESGKALAWRSLAVEADRIDLAARHATIERVALDGGRVLVRPRAPVPLPVLPGGSGAAAAAPPAPAKPGAGGGAPWSWSVGRVAVTDTVATVFLDPPPLDVDVRKLELTGLSSVPGTEATLDAEVGIADGTLSIKGPIVLDPAGGTLRVQATDLDVGRLAAAGGGAAAGVPFTARLDADLDVAAREDPLVVKGRIEARDVEAKEGDGEDFLVAWKRLALAIDRVAVPGLLPLGNGGRVGPVDVHLASAELDEPRVVATITKEGLVLPTGAAEEAGKAPGEPATVRAASPAPAPEAAAEPAPEAGGFSLLVDRLAVRDGDLRVTDTTVTPAYRGRLERLAVDAQGIRVPENRVDAISLSTRVGGGSPIEVTSKRRGDSMTIHGTIRGVPLSQFNPYATAYGYRIARGTLSLDSKTSVRGRSYDSDNEVDIDRLDVTATAGDALFKRLFGIPLSVALAVLKDLRGRISLGIPVSGDQRGGGVAIVSVVREALVRAIVGALASPLKLLGAVTVGNGAIQAFEPEPIAFRPGTTTIAPDSVAQADQLATALERLPALRIRLTGRAGKSDARALAEQAVLADLEQERGLVGGVRNLLSGGTHADVRAALRARAEGEPGPLDEDAARQLDEWVAEHPIGQERLLALATERAAALSARLVNAGARSGQVLVGEPKARRTGGVSEVDVAVASETADAAD